MSVAAAPRPLDGVTVLDCSRMLPGAVLARLLIDLGATVVKVEDPDGGDPLRRAPPLVGGIGAGFCAFYRGARSITLDLRTSEGAQRLLQLARTADVLVESFRPGTLDRWGVGREALRAANERLVVCSLTGFAAASSRPGLPGHDLNFTALTGALHLMAGEQAPAVQLADTTAGLLACSAVLAALLARARSGQGIVIEQPLVTGPLAFLVWALADTAAGGDPWASRWLTGRCPAYRVYSCADGKRVAVATLEPKFWLRFLSLLGLPELSGGALDTGEIGAETAARVAARLSQAPRHHWLALFAGEELPVTAVNDPHDALSEALLSGCFEATPCPDGVRLTTPGPFIPSLSTTPCRSAPKLGEHNSDFLQPAIDS